MRKTNRSTSEAQAIYGALFSRPIPAILRSRYEQANSLLLEKYSPAERQVTGRAIQTVGDLEALEFAARLLHRQPLLSDKFRLMAALAETLPQHQADFIAEAPTPPWLELTKIGLATAWKGIKGLILLGVGR
jgi:hypothetical protein